MGNYVVIGRFDVETNERYLRMRQRLNEAGYATPEWPPHITFAAYENMDEKELCAWVREFCGRHESVSVSLDSLSILPPSVEFPGTAVLCLEPAHSKTFVDLYYAFQAKLGEYCTGIGYRNSISHGSPTIHSTIGVMPTDELQKAMEVIFESRVFGKAEINALEVYTYPMRLIEHFDMKK